MSKREVTVTAAKNLLQTVADSFARVAGSMRDTSMKLDATLMRIKTVHRVGLTRRL